MEEEGIGLVLAKATELRLKISNCIHKSNDPLPTKENGVQVDEEEDEEAQRLFNICDALEALENQLAALQTLQQQQRYEREVSLAEIESSRKMLLNKLKEYKGKDLEVIHEASAFAGETVDHSNDLLLPPYPSRSPHTFVLENGYLQPTHKPFRNGVISNDATNGAKKNLTDTERSKNSIGLGSVLSTAAKTVLTLVGLISVLSLSGFGPKIVRSNTAFNILGRFKQPPTEEKRSPIECPLGESLFSKMGRLDVLSKKELKFLSLQLLRDLM